MIKYIIKKPNESDSTTIYNYLLKTDSYLTPTLSSRVDLKDYSTRLAHNATCFYVYDDSNLVGFGALYFKPSPELSFGTYVSVLKEYQKEMIGVDLLIMMVDYCEEHHSGGYWCAIRKSNKQLVGLYKSLGFIIKEEKCYPNSDVIEYYIEKTFN